MAWLLRVVAGVPAGRRDVPLYRVWTLKDLLAHIAAWDELLLPAIDELVAGRRPRFGRTSVFNKRAVDASRALGYGEVLRDVRAAHTTLMKRIASLSDEAWADRSRHRYRWGDRTPMTIASLFAYSYKEETHYGGHAKEIEDWLARRRAEGD